eukprot:2869986-Prymnesium_polylepis.1
MDKKKMKNIKKPSSRRIARRAGVKRVSGAMHNEFLKSLHAIMSKTLHDSTAVMDPCKKTLTKVDILYALKAGGHGLYV